MTDNKNKIYSVLLSILCIFMLLASVLAYSHSAGESASVTIICAQDSVKVSDMNWKIYKVGERRGGRFLLTEEFSTYPVDMSALSEDNVRGIAQALESFIIGDRIKADAEGITDSNGAAVFNGLDKGIYLAVAKRVKKEPITYNATPLRNKGERHCRRSLPKGIQRYHSTRGSRKLYCKKGMDRR